MRCKLKNSMRFADGGEATTRWAGHQMSLRNGAGGQVPGQGSGDKVPSLYTPGEFVVSNDMIDDNPGLREQLHAMRAQTLAARGKDPLFVDAQQWRGGTLRAEDGEEGMFSRRAQAAVPAPEPIPEVGRPVAPGAEPIPTAIAEGNARGQTFRAEQAAATARMAPKPGGGMDAAFWKGLPSLDLNGYDGGHGTQAQNRSPVANQLEPLGVQAGGGMRSGVQPAQTVGATSVAPRELPPLEFSPKPAPTMRLQDPSAGPSKVMDLAARRAAWDRPSTAPVGPAQMFDPQAAIPPTAPAPKYVPPAVNKEGVYISRAPQAAPVPTSLEPTVGGVFKDRVAAMRNSAFGSGDDWSKFGEKFTKERSIPGSGAVGKLVQKLAPPLAIAGGGYEAYQGVNAGDTKRAAWGAADAAAGAALLTPAAPAAGAYLAARGAYEAPQMVRDAVGEKGLDTIGGVINQIGLKSGLWGVDDSAKMRLDAQAQGPTPRTPAAPTASAPQGPGGPTPPITPGGGDAFLPGSDRGRPSNIIRKGNSYEGSNVSGIPTVNGATMRGAFSDVSDPNVSSTDRVAQIERSAAHEANMARMRAQMGDAANPMAGVTGLIGSGGYGAGRSADQRARDAEVSASSITAPGGRFSLGGRHANHVLGLQSAERIANQNNLAHLAAARMNNDTSVLTTGMNNATMREGNRLNNETSLMTTDMNNRVSLRNNKMNNDFNWGKFQVEVGQKDREHARNVANDNFTQREASTKAMHDHFASLLPPVLVDGKPVADTAGAARLANGFIAQMAAHERTLRADAKAGKPGAQAALDELLQKGPGAYGPEDRQRFAAGMMARDTVAQNHSAPFNPVGGTAPITQAPVVRMRPHKNSALQFGEAYDVEYADGSTGTVPARAIDKDGSFFGGQRRGDFNTLIQR